jgi:alkaline phosphatase
MDSMAVTGYALTRSASDLKTDSAAAATAIASGVKTNNRAIGVDSDGNSVPSILEHAQVLGKSTGLVTNTQITHATPAAFAAHVADRRMTGAIAEQLLDLPVDVLLGGGEDDWLPQDQVGCYPGSGGRTDGVDLIERASMMGYTYVCTAGEFGQVSTPDTARLLGLFADGGMGRPHQPSLAEMTGKAIEILNQNPKGFFLMVEGGQIDWASHQNEASDALGDVLDFDTAVAKGQEFANKHPNTLVIVTSDHETGGMILEPPADGAQITLTGPNGTQLGIGWTTTSHTAVNVPVLAQGPHAWKLRGTYENTHIFDVMIQALK